jgi:uncharacterized protein YqfA (UPF0365 family)
MVRFLLGAVIVLVIIFGGIFLHFLQIWIKAFAARAPVTIVNLVGMRLRGIPPGMVVNARIMAVKAGLEMSTDGIEAHYLAGGRVEKVVRALIAADKANIELTFQQACAIDLAGRDIEEAVKLSVLPRVINCPPSEKGRKNTIDAVAMDGIQLKAKARVTIRANLKQLVGGATDETIIARVGEGIVTAIGSSETYKRVLENPDVISKKVLEKGLDSGTAYEILSIDIADVDVGENIGAALQARQAETDKQIAQAKAEERYAMARAAEQEMSAKVEEMRARVVEAEAEVPRAISHAFREGKLGVMDYYNLRNIQADTSMRGTIGGKQPEGNG